MLSQSGYYIVQLRYEVWEGRKRAGYREYEECRVDDPSYCCESGSPFNFRDIGADIGHVWSVSNYIRQKRLNSL
jgi:hypothetical protein